MTKLYRPKDLAEAVSYAKEEPVMYIAGGTVVMVLKNRNELPVDALVSLNDIPNLKEIVEKEDCIEIGALVTFSQLEKSELIKKYCYSLYQASFEMGGPQIRNRATIGGNVAGASPSADSATPLLSYGASIKAYGLKGEREIPIREFFKGRFETVLSPDEILVSISVPKKEAKSNFIKVGNRNALSVAAINMAIYSVDGKVDIAVGAASPKAVYLEKTSAYLSSTPYTPEVLKEAQSLALTEISPINDRWATKSYREKVCGRLLKKSLEIVKEV